jgi:hypothetical protein
MDLVFRYIQNIMNEKFKNLYYQEDVIIGSKQYQSGLLTDW